MTSYADQFAALGDQADQNIASITTQPKTTAQADASRLAGQHVDAAVAAAKPPAPTPSATFSADTAPGHIRWGLSQPIADQSVPEGAHRTYFQSPMTQAAAMVAQAKSDLARRAVPWLSFKPGPWAAAGTGAIDSGLDNLFKGLAGAAGPVIVTAHHEPFAATGAPDDPGGVSAFLAMSRRVRARLNASGARNVTLVPVYISGTVALPNFAGMYDASIFDAFGIDIYDQKGDLTANPHWAQAVAFAKSVNKRMMIGEWGVLDAGDPTGVINRSRDAMLNNHVAVACYFNSTANSVANWVLSGARLAAWVAQARNTSSVPASAT